MNDDHPIDECLDRLHRAGWSVGDAGFGSVRQVDGIKGGKHAVRGPPPATRPARAHRASGVLPPSLVPVVSTMRSMVMHKFGAFSFVVAVVVMSAGAPAIADEPKRDP